MKKIIIFSICLIFSITSMSMTLEVKAGFDTGFEDDARSDLNILPGYRLKAELMTGQMIEYGLGIGYSEFGKTNISSNASEEIKNDLDDKSYMTSKTIYGTTKINFGSEGFNPYFKINAGITLNDAGDFFKSFSENYEKLYVSDGADSASVNISVNDGVYLALGLGMEYNRFLFELMYEYISISRDISGTTTTAGTTTSINDLTIDNLSVSTITIEVGYRFGLGNN